MTKKFICGYQQSMKNRNGKVLASPRVCYVSELKGDGGVDWGYTDKRELATPMSKRMAAIYMNECVPNRFMNEG